MKKNDQIIPSNYTNENTRHWGIEKNNITMIDVKEQMNENSGNKDGSVERKKIYSLQHLVIKWGL